MSESTTQARPKPRIESLSDMIFGLALSVGAITLVGNPPQTRGQLYGDIASFGFSFLIVIQIWIRYTRVMSVLPLETGRTIFFNIFLLFLVSIEPFLFHILNGPLAQPVSIAYAVDLGLMNVILAFFTLTLASEDRKLIPADMIKEFKNGSIFQFVTAGIFFISIAPIFWSVDLFGLALRYDLWFVPLIAISVLNRIPKNRKSSS